ncbi:MAG: GNAT family N-acetyltransferase [Chloroflexi bacterium]|nr:GNAT family N-acetyltransferase [Chloroflexota bacterium]
MTVFRGSPDYFERYYHADPWYCEGDSLGAWAGATLVSAVHLCRRPLHYRGDIVWCGGIANVATLEEHRGQGLSRRLLSLIIERMEKAGMGFSMLGTGRPGHYAALGWQAAPLPAPTVTFETPDGPTDSIPMEAAASITPEIQRIYQDGMPAPLRLDRPDAYFSGWVGWNLRHSSVELLTLPRRGYLAFSNPSESGAPAAVREWGAVDAETEAVLLAAAGRLARERGAAAMRLVAVPVGGMSRLEGLGAVARSRRGGTMFRNVSLPGSEYQEILRLYESGEARWWPADGF